MTDKNCKSWMNGLKQKGFYYEGVVADWFGQFIREP